MNENTKTGVFAGVAALVALATWITYPRTSEKEGTVDRPEYLFEKYDPFSAATLKIVKYNKDVDEVTSFEVAKDKGSGVWTIPSHAGYPADAAKQMSDAANTFIELKVLDVVTEKRDEHKMFGVVEPDPEKIQAGDEGVGTLVRLQDEKGNNLVNLVIGSTEKDNPKHRFLRIPSQDVVYIAELDIGALTTDFTRWIEADLLKLSSTDIQKLGIRDYSIIQTNQGAALNPNFDADVSFTTTDGKWTADSIKVHQGADTKPRAVGDEEQLNATKLNEIKNALDSLRIVDVRRKPKGLAANLKVENALLEDKESIVAMARRGFIPQKSPDGGSEIYAANGELLATLKDGVQYLVRFGNTTGESSESEKKEGEPKADDSVQLDRYMLVTAQLDESMFPPVALKPLPETYEDLLKMEAAEKPSEASSLPAAPSVDPIENAPPAAPKEAEPKKEGDEPKEESKESKEADVKQSEAPSEKKDQALQINNRPKYVSLQESPKTEGKDASKETIPDASKEPPAETKPAEGTTKPAEDSKPVAETKSDTKAQPPTEEEKKEKLEAARERITKENQRMIDERNEKMEAARKKVAELNARFSDWFYVISESEYKRLRIKLEELIQPKSASTTPPPPGGAGFPGGLPGGFPGGFPGPGN